MGAYQEAMAYALRLLAGRAYSQGRLMEKLSARFPQEAVAEVLERLKAMGYLDDRAFARSFVETHRKYGPLKLKALLLAQGIPEEVAEEAVGEASLEDALKVLLRYPRRQDKAKAVRFLLGRGFPLGVALEAYRLAQEEEKG